MARYKDYLQEIKEVKEKMFFNEGKEHKNWEGEKVVCVVCNGEEEVEKIYYENGVPSSMDTKPCPECDGLGYIWI